MSSRSQLLAAAVDVLRTNDTGVFVKPGSRQYPGQWNWDAAFVAIGLAHVDPARARDEVRALLSGQWDDGMVPHIVFHRSDVDYFPGPEVWGRVPSMPTVATSGITQPPLLATAVAAIHRLDPRPGFLEEVVPALDRWHRWFHRRRAGPGSLVTILHPWESGMDNSPRFDAALHRVPPSQTRFERRDHIHVAAAQRPTEVDYQAYLSILEQLRAVGYRPRIGTEVFAVGDVFLSAVLAHAERDLARLWHELGRDGSAAGERATGLERAIAAAWDPGSGLFRDRNGDDARTIGGLVPVYALPDHPAGAWVAAAVGDPDDFGPAPATPWYPTSVSRRDPSFDLRRYWRGPVWVNINWLLADATERAGRHRLAADLRRRTVEMVADHGFWEYYHPETGEGLGSDTFSWTAAVILDFLHRR